MRAAWAAGRVRERADAGVSVPDEEHEPRPAPMYGEYATPEQQRAAISQPDATFALDAGQAPEAFVQRPAAAPTGAAARPTRTADRIITIALLAYGLLTVLASAVQMLDVAAFAQTMFTTLGVDGQLSDPAAAQPWATAAAITLVLGWALTAWLSYLSLRARRLTWWIPLVGAIVVNLIAALIAVIGIMNDPGLMQMVGAGTLG